MAESSGNLQNSEAEAEQELKMSSDMDKLLQNQNSIFGKLQQPSRRQLRRRRGSATALQPLSSFGVINNDASQYHRVLFGDGQASFPAAVFGFPSSPVALMAIARQSNGGKP